MQIRVLALVALPAAAGLQASAGRLLAVRPAGDAEASVIELVGDRPLSFTTLRLATPPRVVVDVSDADPSGVAPAQVVDDGTVRRVGVASVGTTARVVIELAGEAEFDVSAVGAVVQVRVARLAPLLAKAEPPRPARGPPREVAPPAVRLDGSPAPIPEPPPERRVALAPVSEPSRPAATPEPSPPAPGPAPAPAEPRQTAPLAIAAAPTVAIPPPAGATPGPAQPPATRPEPPPVAPQAEARAENPATPQAPPSPEPPPAPRATAPAEVAQASPPPAKPVAEPRPPAAAQAPPAAPVAPARPPEIAATPQPAVAPPRAQPPPPPATRPPAAGTAAAPKAPSERRVARAESTASREEVERARASIPTVSIVASPPPAAAAEAPAVAPPRAAPAKARASITGIGFRPSAGGIVMVRSDRPLEYAVTGEARVVVVHLRGAGIPIPTNRLPLDTRFFDTSVVRVVPEPVAGGIDLRIELRGQTRYQLSQSSGLLTIAFERS